MLNEKLIPKGVYCDGCPYFTRLTFYDDNHDISVPFCIFINKGSVPNGMNENDFNKLTDLLGLSRDIEKSDNTLYDFLSADLLWDGCKECGVNMEYNKEELI